MMLADIRLTDHSRRWRLRQHLRQATLGAQVGLGASTIFADEHSDVGMRSRRKTPRRTPLGMSGSQGWTTPAEERSRL